jgi:1-aminocyclopropane-1-carboxylate synthase
MKSLNLDQGSTQKPSEAVNIPALSARAATSYDSTSGRLWTILSDLWDPESNQEGYITLGVADNALLQNDIVQRINECSDVPKHILTYNNGPS